MKAVKYEPHTHTCIQAPYHLCLPAQLYIQNAAISLSIAPPAPSYGTLLLLLWAAAAYKNILLIHYKIIILPAQSYFLSYFMLQYMHQRHCKKLWDSRDEEIYHLANTWQHETQNSDCETIPYIKKLFFSFKTLRKLSAGISKNPNISDSTWLTNAF